jgi:F0F1-type ATP synthase assembly protein I
MKKKDLQTRFYNPKKRISNLNNYAKYSSLSIQMIVIVLAGAFGGIKLDKWINWNFPFFTLLLSFLGVVLAIYIAIKDFLKK